mgnify:CR=1 FL=1
MREFTELFKALTGNEPFPWQQALFDRFTSPEIAARFPSTCDIPTGLGKTSVMAVWLLALAHHALNGEVRSFPRRLVYVVNRRTVVDQSTREAVQLRRSLHEKPELKEVATALRALASKTTDSPLAISTLRGQFADNAEWRDDPARPAVIFGTVDMIGSRLLFSGYGRGFRSRPLHAAFLGQDSVLVHDEAHLEPAFQALIEAIRAEQQLNEWERNRFHVIALSATSRSGDHAFGLTEADQKNPVVDRRFRANKAITLHTENEKKVADRIASLALDDSLKNSGKAVLIFVRRVKDVSAIASALRKAKQEDVETLTGTKRGYERDQFVKSNAIFARFMPPSDRTPDLKMAEGTVYLICTSAGEVGVNISADYLVCDLTPFDSMAQRFGRVNRFGADPNHVARIEVVVGTRETKETTKSDGPDKINEFDLRCERTNALLRKLTRRSDGSGFDASPAALSALPLEERLAAFSPQPTILPVTDILFDAWSMTTIREPLPGRPPVDDFLHGLSEYEPPQTQVAWRQEVESVTRDVLESHPAADLLEDFPLKAHEVLHDQTDRVVDELSEIAKRHPDTPVWVVERDDNVRVSTLSTEILAFDRKRVETALRGCTVLLPPSSGGLSNGLLDGAKPFSAEDEPYDVADQWLDEDNKPRRVRKIGDESPPGMRLVRRIDLSKPPEEVEDDGSERIWCWYAQPWSADDDGSRSARQKELLTDHLGKAREHAAALASKLVDEPEASAVTRAAEWHDLGKNRRVWQRSIGNLKAEILAKSGPRMRPLQITKYRHEFGSLLDVEAETGFAVFGAPERDLIKHLIAAHHGRARPHFPIDEAFDPERPTSKAISEARDVPRRFSELQRRYGRWGLAYLESLVRAADALASQDIGAVESMSNEAAE